MNLGQYAQRAVNNFLCATDDPIIIKLNALGMTESISYINIFVPFFISTESTKKSKNLK